MTDLAPLLVKWLTHDFASPIATVMTASELLSDTPDAEITALVQDSARRLASRLRLVRAALAAGDAPLGNDALERLVRAGIDGTPLVWSCTACAHPVVIAGAALLMADLRRGQPLIVTDTDVRWQTPFAIPPSVAAALTGAAATDPRAAVAAMLAAAAARTHLVLTATADGIAWS